MFVTLIQIKKHLNIDDSYIDDDVYLTDLIDVCESAVQKHINDTFLSYTTDGIVDPDLIHAVKLLAGHFYQNREIVSVFKATELTKSYDYLLSFFIKY